MRRVSSLLAVLTSMGAVLGACVTDPTESWLPQEVDVTDTLEHAGDKAYSMLCEQFSSYVHGLYSSQPLVRAACTAHALSSTANALQCEQATASCLETLPQPVESQLEAILAQASCERAEVARSGCPSLVSELIACLDELRSELDKITMTATCTAFGSRVPADWWRIVQPSSCVELATRCRPGRQD